MATDSQPAFLPRSCLQALIDQLQTAGYQCLGPQVSDGAIVMNPIESIDQLPQGVRDHQAPGEFRLHQAGDERCFAWANGPQALKPLLFVPREVLWQARPTQDGVLRFTDSPEEAGPPTSLIGARACDLAALALLDAHFLKPPHPDPHYARRRARLFVVGVDCSHPAQTCFCVSTGDGPRIENGGDLILTELEDGYLIRSGSPEGERQLRQLPLEEASSHHLALAEQQYLSAVAAQKRRLPARDISDALFANLDHDRWQDVADRCLACGNCTSVCPTCFCSANYEVPQLDGQRSDHVREWSSCFSLGHSYTNSHVVRASTRERYRQWLTHKLGGWHEQYGRSGCVGCGRCITWCPSGIDITEEAAAICGDDGHDQSLPAR